MCALSLVRTHVTGGSSWPLPGGSVADNATYQVDKSWTLSFAGTTSKLAHVRSFKAAVNFAGEGLPPVSWKWL